MPFFLLLLLPLLGGIGCFFYFYLRRIALTLGLEPKRKLHKLLLLIPTLLLTLLSVMITSSVSIFILHVAGIGAMLMLADRILHRCFRKRYEAGFRGWKMLYGCGILPILLSAAVFVGGYLNLHTVVRTDYIVTTQKQIRQEGYRVALIADVHFGVSLDYGEVLEVCEEINSADPDLVILCGDIVDNGTSPEEMQEIFRALGTLKSELGTFYVYGNHDRSMSMMKSEFSDETLLAALEENGITVLQDTTLQLTDDLVLIGREDLSRERSGARRKSVAQLAEGFDKTDYLLVLDHQPNQYEENGQAGTDLLLSGHTHGGQIFPLNLLMKIIPFNDGTYGTYAIGEQGTAIVTSGFAGWNFPIKTAAPAEYVIVDVKTE